MRAGVDLRKVPQAFGEVLAVHEDDIEPAVVDLRPGSEPHASGHDAAVGGHDADEGPLLFRAVVDREPDGPIGVAQGGRQGGQAEGEEPAELLVTRLDPLDDLAADPGLAFVDEAALDRPAAGLPIDGPADVDPAGRSEGDPGALGLEVRRQPQALGETVARAGIDDADRKQGRGELPGER